jgi:hypothetical protein
VRLQHELADVDRHVATGDVGDHHVQARAVRHHRVDERRAHVDPPSGRAEHPLDEVGELSVPKDRRRQLLRPRRAMNTRPGSLTQISSIFGSSM